MEICLWFYLKNIQYNTPQHLASATQHITCHYIACITPVFTTLVTKEFLFFFCLCWYDSVPPYWGLYCSNSLLIRFEASFMMHSAFFYQHYFYKLYMEDEDCQNNKWVNTFVLRQGSAQLFLLRRGLQQLQLLLLLLLLPWFYYTSWTHLLAWWFWSSIKRWHTGGMSKTFLNVSHLGKKEFLKKCLRADLILSLNIRALLRGPWARHHIATAQCCADSGCTSNVVVRHVLYKCALTMNASSSVLYQTRWWECSGLTTFQSLCEGHLWMICEWWLSLLYTQAFHVALKPFPYYVKTAFCIYSALSWM